MRALNVYMQGDFAGQLTRSAEDEYTFNYDENYIEQRKQMGLYQITRLNIGKPIA